MNKLSLAAMLVFFNVIIVTEEARSQPVTYSAPMTTNHVPYVESYSVAQPQTVQITKAYYSPKLKAQLKAQFMEANFPNVGTISFWGARIVGMDLNSPLKSLPNVQLGDVITRIDGISIGTDLSKPDGQAYFNIPQVEQHFGWSEFRWMKTGTTKVLVNTINLDAKPMGGGSSDGGVILP